MIENQYCFSCEPMVSFVIAATVWIAGFLFFIVGVEKPVNFKTEFLPGKSKEEANEFQIEFLQDLIKWAEMLMEELEDARRVFERKAFLIVWLSFAIIGYLFSDISTLDKSWGGWSFIVYSSFGIAAILGIKVIDFASYWPRGQHPSAFHQGMLAGTPTGKEQKWAMYYMLEVYRGNIDKNRKTNTEKYNSLHVAKYFLILGAGGLLSMALESSGRIASICCWLANKCG